MAWDDEKRNKAVQMYQDAEPTPENSVEIVNEIAEELDESPNGVRMILSKANVYLKKTPAAKTSTSTTKGESKGTRVSKEDAHNALKAAIEGAGKPVDDEIISKLTGKAAVYFTGLFDAKDEE